MSMQENTRAEVIVTCLKKRLSGVTTTITNLLPEQAQQLKLGYCGSDIPGLKEAAASPSFVRLSLWQAILASRKRLPDGRKIIWHVRRDNEMILGLLLRGVLRLPIALVFTSAATRRHGRWPLWLISRMDSVIATTPLAHEKIADVAPKNTRVIPHGVNTRAFVPPADQTLAWQESGLPGKFGIGVFGRVRHQKGIHLFVPALIELLPRYPDFTAVICGLCKPEDEAYKAELVAKIEAAGLAHRFVWLGLVPAEDLALWYQRVSITVACPLNEGFGLTPIEGMACGSAVVASRTGAFEEIVVEGQTGHLVPTDDVPALIHALDKLMRDPALINRMALAGRKRVVTHYSIEAEARRIGEVYALTQAASQSVR
jgi:mannosyltransferase